MGLGGRGLVGVVGLRLVGVVGLSLVEPSRPCRLNEDRELTKGGSSTATETFLFVLELLWPLFLLILLFEWNARFILFSFSSVPL